MVAALSDPGIVVRTRRLRGDLARLHLLPLDHGRLVADAAGGLDDEHDVGDRQAGDEVDGEPAVQVPRRDLLGPALANACRGPKPTLKIAFP